MDLIYGCYFKKIEVIIMFIVRFLLLSLSFSICAQEQQAKRSAPENQDTVDEVLQLVVQLHDKAEAKKQQEAKEFNYKNFIKPLSENQAQCFSEGCETKFDTVPNKLSYLSSSVWTHCRIAHAQEINGLKYVNPNHICPVCNKKCEDKTKKQNHINVHHADSEYAKLIECNNCYLNFTNATAYKQHLQISCIKPSLKK